MKLPQLPPPQIAYIPCSGGLDTESTPWETPSGMVREAQNYEIAVTGGYQDIQGYERFDGRTKPSDGVYAILNVTISGAFGVGNTITQLVSGATAVILAVVTTDLPFYLVITRITGTFDATHDLQVATTTQGTATSLAITDGAQTALLHARYKNLAADNYRASITTVPGTGSILGVWQLNDIWYAFRDYGGGAGAKMYKATTAGWVNVSLGQWFVFASGGTYVIAEGDTITGATSGATAVITRVQVQGGTWAGGNAYGFLYMASHTGTFQAENLNVGANLNVATVYTDALVITITTGGRFEFVNNNFGGTFNEERMYGVDGKNFAFEFDGSIWVWLPTAWFYSDIPTHICVHKNYLFLSFDYSVQFSSIADPYSWSPVTGAGEINAGDTVTGFMVEPGDAAGATLGIYCKNQISILYGSSASDFNLVKYREEIGARFGTIQQAGKTLFSDDNGVTTLATTQAYGGFAHDTFTANIKRWINDRRGLTAYSCLCREKNQYRLFFSDKYSLWITLEQGKIIGMMPMLFLDKPTCVASRVTSGGVEEIMFGCDDGYVYQMEKGTSFDGDALTAYCIIQYSSLKTLRLKKKFLSATFELQGTGYAEFSFSYSLGYGDSRFSQPGNETEIPDFGFSTWDDGTWDVGSWDGLQLLPERYRLSGSGENIALIIRKNSDEYEPLTFNGVVVRHIPRRGLR